VRPANEITSQEWHLFSESDLLDHIGCWDRNFFRLPNQLESTATWPIDTESQPFVSSPCYKKTDAFQFAYTFKTTCTSVDKLNVARPIWCSSPNKRISLFFRQFCLHHVHVVVLARVGSDVWVANRSSIIQAFRHVFTTQIVLSEVNSSGWNSGDHIRVRAPLGTFIRNITATTIDDVVIPEDVCPRAIKRDVSVACVRPANEITSQEWHLFSESDLLDHIGCWDRNFFRLPNQLVSTTTWPIDTESQPLVSSPCYKKTDASQFACTFKTTCTSVNKLNVARPVWCSSPNKRMSFFFRQVCLRQIDRGCAELQQTQIIKVYNVV